MDENGIHLILLKFELNMNMEKFNPLKLERLPTNGSQKSDRLQTNGSTSTTSYRETHMRQSYIFSNNTQPQQRSFISTSLVNDTYAYGDDLRKYRHRYIDLEYRIYLIIKKTI
jgi:hypothetical protein